MARVYIFLAEGFEEIEALTVVDILRRAQIEIGVVSVTGSRQITGSHQIPVIVDYLFEDLDYMDAELLVLPGGMPGTKHLMQHEGLDRLLKKFHSGGKKLAAICAAPSVLGSKGLLAGKNAVCYPGFESCLKDAVIMKEDVVRDDNLVTSRGMGTAIDFSLSLVKMLKDEETARNIASSIQYRHYV